MCVWGVRGGGARSGERGAGARRERARGRSGVSCEAAGRGVRALGRWGVGVLGSGQGGAKHKTSFVLKQK